MSLIPENNFVLCLRKVSTSATIVFGLYLALSLWQQMNQNKCCCCTILLFGKFLHDIYHWFFTLWKVSFSITLKSNLWNLFGLFLLNELILDYYVLYYPFPPSSMLFDEFYFILGGGRGGVLFACLTVSFVTCMIELFSWISRQWINYVSKCSYQMNFLVFFFLEIYWAGFKLLR